MNKIFALFLLVSALNTALFAQSDDLRQQVIKCDAELNALIQKNDAVKAAGFYASEFSLVTSSGKVKRKQDIVREIGLTTLVFEINETDHIEVIVEGNTAVLSGVLHQKGRYQDQAFDHQLRVTDTWVKTPEGWKLLAGHATLLPKT